MGDKKHKVVHKNALKKQRSRVTSPKSVLQMYLRALEERLLKWIYSQDISKLTRVMIRKRALLFYKEMDLSQSNLTLDMFKASKNWCQNFIRRYKVVYLFKANNESEVIMKQEKETEKSQNINDETLFIMHNCCQCSVPLERQDLQKLQQSLLEQETPRSRLRPRIHQKEEPSMPDTNYFLRDNERIRNLSNGDFFANISEGIMSIEDVCIACNDHDAHCFRKHPDFYGGLCKSCSDEMDFIRKIYLFDYRNYYCAICAGPGKLILCENEVCGRVYCQPCVKLLTNHHIDDPLFDSPWNCFMCSKYSRKTHELIKPRAKWEDETGYRNDLQDSIFHIEDNTVPQFPKRPIRVMSLFDGISAGMVTLKKLNLKIEKYFASEICESAMDVAVMNHGKNAITYLGDVRTITDVKIGTLCPIDLLIGGSPCNDLSVANPSRKGLLDSSGTGCLFYQYVRVMKAIQMNNIRHDVHLFWMYENVASMKWEDKNCIDSMFQRGPVKIDAQHYSAQRRNRYYWGNLPGMYNLKRPQNEITQPNNCLSNNLMPVINRVALKDKIYCVTTVKGGSWRKSSDLPPISWKGKPDSPWPTEIEMISGFPLHYTDLGCLSSTERQNLLGRSWSIPVVERILQPLQQYFELQEKKNRTRYLDN